MHFSEPALLVYLIVSMAFCWLAVTMATLNRPARKPEFGKPRAQLVISVVLYISLLFIFAGMHVFGTPLKQYKELPDIIFAGLMAVSAIVAAVASGNGPASVGLPLRGIETTLFFLVPPLALLYFPGHFVNLKLLWGGIGPMVVAVGFSEELFFRGFFQTRLESIFGNTRGLLIAAAAYAVFRLPMMWGTLPPVGLAVNLAGTFLIWGCAAGLIYRRAGNIYGLFLLHVFWDTALRVFLGFGMGN
jgi:membrane protease YdiL (CAAX protease family)